MSGPRTLSVGLLLAVSAALAASACGGETPNPNDQTSVTVTPPGSAPAGTTAPSATPAPPPAHGW